MDGDESVKRLLATNRPSIPTVSSVLSHMAAGEITVMVLVFREKTDKNTEVVTNPFGVSMPRYPLAVVTKNIDISIKV